MLLALFALVGAGLYLNLVGLPDFLRQPLLETLRERGLDLQVASLRWHFYRGIVAEDLKFGRLGDASGPRVTAREAELNLNYHALLDGQIEVRGVGVREGRVSVAVNETNEPARLLAIEKIRVDLRLLPDDVWLLEDFHAAFAGADFFLSGAITNASVVRELSFFREEKAPPEQPAGEKRRGVSALGRRLRKFADTLEKIHFTSPPEIRGMLSGDAREVESFTLRLTVSAPDAETPWGKFTDGVLTARLRPAAPVERPQAEMQLQAGSVLTRWAEVSRPRLTLRVIGTPGDTNVVNATLSAQAAVVVTPWARTTNTQFTARWVHSLTNAIPLSGTGELHADSAVTRWAGAKAVALNLTLATPANPPAADPAWGDWELIRPYALGWTVRAARFDTEKIGAEEIVCAGHWAAPDFVITNLLVRFPEGQLTGQASLGVNDRVARFEIKSDFDAHRVSPLLTPKAAKWLTRYSWKTAPPRLAGSGTVVLPAWTNRSPDWRGEVLPTLTLDASVRATNCAYLRIPADWVQTSIHYSNLVWHLPDLVAGRPEGTLELAHVANDRTHEYWFGLRSGISPDALRPVLSTNALRGLSYFQLTTPPRVAGGVWGRWREPESVAFTGRVELAEFSFREENVGRFASALRYTNRFLEFLEPRMERGTQSVHGAGVALDLPARRVYLTNMLSTIEPMLITRWIGPKTAAALTPYVFREAPTVRVNGFAPLSGNSDAELHFEVEGGPFEWWKFHIPRIQGEVHWLGDWLVLTNIQMRAYSGGTAAGHANFDLGASAGTPFELSLGVTNVDLKSLMLDVATRTNQLEGRLNGLLVVTNANSTNAFTWNGHGRAELRDGLIWAIPVFGVLSKPLDSLVPGLGSARISDATTTFAITNGVMFSDNLEMRANTTRLQYEGTVDFDGRVNTRVRAEPMRDTLVLGPVLNAVLWPVTKLFEYKITGTLAEPKPEPLHIPKVFYKPILHPFQTLEGLFTPQSSGTNAEPKP